MISAGHVVEIRFEQASRSRFRAAVSAVPTKNRSRLARFGKILRPRSVADRLDGHLRQRAKTVDDRFQDRRAGWRRQLRVDRHVDERDSLEQLGRSRRRHGADAVIDPHLAAACRHAAGDDLIGAEHVESDRRPDNVDDGIDRPDFVKVDAVDSRAVHAGFGVRNRAKDPPGQVFLARSDAAARSMIAWISARWRWACCSGCSIRTAVARKPCFTTVLRGELDPLQAERIDGRADDRGIDARVDQRRPASCRR